MFVQRVGEPAFTVHLYRFGRLAIWVRRKGFEGAPVSVCDLSMGLLVTLSENWRAMLR